MYRSNEFGRQRETSEFCKTQIPGNLIPLFSGVFMGYTISMHIDGYSAGRRAYVTLLGI